MSNYLEGRELLQEGHAMSEASVAWQHVTLPVFHQRPFRELKTAIHTIALKGKISNPALLKSLLPQ